MPIYQVKGEQGTYIFTTAQPVSKDELDKMYAKRAKKEEVTLLGQAGGALESLYSGVAGGGKGLWQIGADITQSSWAQEMADAAAVESRRGDIASVRAGTPELIRAVMTTAPRMAPVGLAAAAGGWALPAAIGISGAQQYGEQSHEYQKIALDRLRRGGKGKHASGADLRWMAFKEAFPLALTSGLKTAAITGLGGRAGRALQERYGLGIVTGLESVAAGAPSREALKRSVGSVIGSAALESVEEGLDEAFQVAIDTVEFRPDITQDEITQRLTDALILGGIFGGGIATITEIDTARQIKKKLREAEEQDAADSAILRPYVEEAADRVLERRLEIISQAIPPMPTRLVGISEEDPNPREVAGVEVWARAIMAGVSLPNLQNLKTEHDVQEAVEQLWAKTVQAERGKEIKEAATVQEKLTTDFLKKLKGIADQTTKAGIPPEHPHHPRYNDIYEYVTGQARTLPPLEEGLFTGGDPGLSLQQEPEAGPAMPPAPPSKKEPVGLREFLAAEPEAGPARPIEPGIDPIAGGEGLMGPHEAIEAERARARLEGTDPEMEGQILREERMGMKAADAPFMWLSSKSAPPTEPDTKAEAPFFEQTTEGEPDGLGQLDLWMGLRQSQRVDTERAKQQAEIEETLAAEEGAEILTPVTQKPSARRGSKRKRGEEEREAQGFLRKAQRAFRRLKEEGRYRASSLPIDVMLGATGEVVVSAILAAQKATGNIRKAINAGHATAVAAGINIPKEEFDVWAADKLAEIKRIVSLSREEDVEGVEKAAIKMLAAEANAKPSTMMTEADINDPPSGFGKAIKYAQRAYHGTTAVLRDSAHPKQMELAAAISNSLDTGDGLTAEGLRMFVPEVNRSAMEKWTAGHSEELDSAKKEFMAYREARQIWHDGDKKGTAPRIDKISPLAQKMVKGWDTFLQWSGKRMEDGRVQVKTPGGVWRNFKALATGEDAHFEPRRLKDRFAFALRNFGESDTNPEIKEALDEMTQIMKDGGKLKEDATVGDAIAKMLGFAKSEAGRGVPTGFVPSIERARVAKEIPVGLLDMSFDGAVDYISTWGERMGQIEHFGQSTGRRTVKGKGAEGDIEVGMDIFEETIDALDREGKVGAAEYVEKVREMAYNPRVAKGGLQKGATVLSKAATATMLGGGMQAIKNMTGMGVTAMIMPVESIKAAVQTTTEALFGATLGKSLMKGLGNMTGAEFIEVKSYADRTKDSVELGILRNQLSAMLGGHDLALDGASKWRKLNKFLDRANERVLQTSGFSTAERFVRNHASATANMFRASALEGYMKNGEGDKKFKELKRFLDTQISIDLGKLIDEFKVEKATNSTELGPETRKFIRRTVKTVQGGYRYDQLPVFMGTALGKFMGKFFPYGMQVATTIDENVWRPFKEDLKAGKLTRESSGKVLMSLAIAAGMGEAVQEIREFLFGKKRTDATGGEILAQLESGNTDAAIKGAWNRVAGDIFYVGILGTVVDTVGNANAFINKKRHKDPLDPAGLNLLNQVAMGSIRMASERGLSWDNIESFLRKSFTQYNYGEGLVNTQLGARMGWDSARLYEARQDRSVVRAITERFAGDEGVDLQKAFMPPKWLPAPSTKYYTGMQNALDIGDVGAAKEWAVSLSESLEPEQRKKIAGRISQSIKARQPLKIGKYYNKDLQQDFMDWGERNLTDDQMNSIFRAQERYMNAAEISGLVSESEPSLRRETVTLLNGEPPKRRSRPTSPVMTLDEYMRREGLMDSLRR